MAYSLGDKVLMRDKKSLVNEYGTHSNGAIRQGFCPAMMAYCGRVGVIVNAVYSMYTISFDVDTTCFTYPESTIIRKVE